MVDEKPVEEIGGKPKEDVEKVTQLSNEAGMDYDEGEDSEMKVGILKAIKKYPLKVAVTSVRLPIP
jgi:hypothetical protein